MGGESETCTPTPDEGFAAFGEVVTNDGDTDLILSGANLITSRGLQHEESYIMLIEETADWDSGAVLGTASTIPASPAETEAWERREILENFTLRPGESANVIVALSLFDPATDGEAEGIRMTYEDGSRDFTADITNRIVLTAEESCA
ncbi:hypothetical protein GCM10027404_22300 [Arthrobacter tumbae]